MLQVPFFICRYLLLNIQVPFSTRQQATHGTVLFTPDLLTPHTACTSLPTTVPVFWNVSTHFSYPCANSVAASSTRCHLNRRKLNTYRDTHPPSWENSTWQVPSQLSHSDTGHFVHYSGVIRGAITSQIASLTIVYSLVYSGANQGNHQSSASLAFGWGIHRWPVNSPHKWPVMRNMFPFDDVIMVGDGVCYQTAPLSQTGAICLTTMMRHHVVSLATELLLQTDPSWANDKFHTTMIHPWLNTSVYFS